jgi:uncharacterized protein (DUF1800 family)
VQCARPCFAARTVSFSPPDLSIASPVPRVLQAAAIGAAVAGLAACGGGHVGTPGPEGTVQAAGLPGSGGEPPAQPAEADWPGAVDAARFLAQASFGARSPDEIEALRTMGYQRWLWTQFNAPTLVHTSYLDWQRQRNQNLKASEDMSYEAIWQQWLFGEDRLRARVAFALSQILVVSNIAPDLRPYAMSSYMDLLNRHAFGNYRTLLRAMTLHPAMGYFLNLLRSEKEDAQEGTRPNENYAREFLQLFTVGLVKLDAQGTPLRDGAGQTVPTYDEATVQGFARALTGWSFAQSKHFHDADENLDANWTTPMVPFADRHETGTKRLLDGTTISGGGPESDLDAVIDSAFLHPNTGPFVCRQLIQRLVTSNPSPAYIGRVAAVFADNGQGMRGDLRAVVRAVLLDAEARDASLAAGGRFGKQREPVLRLANLLRAMNVQGGGGRNAIHELDATLGQSPLLAPSVFNFFSPNYRPAGAIAAAGLAAPEFQITTEASVAGGLNFLVDVVQGGGIGWGDGRLTFDWAPWETAAATSASLLDRLDALFCQRQMSAATRTRLQALVEAVPAAQARRRVQKALIFLSLAPDHVIQK